jgi:hypothetical protein
MVATASLQGISRNRPLPLGPVRRRGEVSRRFLVLRHLVAENAAGIRVQRVAGNPDGPAVGHGYQQTAAVGTVIGADGAMGFRGHGRILGIVVCRG